MAHELFRLGISENEYKRIIAHVQEGRISQDSVSQPCTEDLAGRTVCFTGTSSAVINGELVSRSTLEELAAEKGMIVKRGVTKSLELLVCADPKSMSGKAKKAREYGIRIMAESAFLRKLGIC